jgi:hypothetical protein
MSIRANISKSSYLAGLQCQKLLWHLRKAPKASRGHDEKPDPAIEQGRQVGLYAQKLFPGGVSIPWDIPFSERTILTRDAISRRVPIYEAAISADGLYSQIDVLVPAPGGRWDINEVKSSTEVKDEHLPDIAFQRHACEAYGLKIRKCLLLHIDGSYVRRGDINPKKLFAFEDVTELLETHGDEIEDNLADLRKALTLKAAPQIGIGHHCSNPRSCPLTDECWAYLPKHSVFDLYRGRKKAWELFEDDILGLADIPDDFNLTASQAIQVSCARKRRPRLDPAGIKEFLTGLSYPLHLLDFETINPAIPLFEGTSPYQQIPFQFSLHVLAKPGAKPVHTAWLAEGCDDPRPAFLDVLKSALGPKGDIMAYNMAFEKARLSELAKDFPAHARWIARASERFVDLLVPFRRFDYHHPSQHGSCSIKAVLPALTGKGYGDMEIGDGSTASNEFMRVTYGDVPESERRRVRRLLEQYCEQDTLGMAWILDELARI